MRRAWVVGLGLWTGCAATPGGEPAAPATALTRSAAVALGAQPTASAVTAAGAGVTVRWAQAQAPLSAVSDGLGAVVATRAEPAGGVTLVHASGVEERWSVTPAGAEQTWRYATRPAGDRVAVTVTLAGTALEREADDGLWLRTAAGGSLRYGHATWVDARGRRTAVRGRWVGGRVAIEVPAEVVAAAAYPAVLDPTITPSFGVEALRSTASYEEPVNVVRTSAGALVFREHMIQLRNGSRSFIMTVELLDPTGAPVPGTYRGVPATAGTVRAFAGAAPSPTGAWLFWPRGSDVVGARVDATGRSLDRAPVLLQAGATAVDLACNSTQCMLLSQRDRTLLGTRFTLSGAVLDATPLVLGAGFSPAANGPPQQYLAALDDRFVAVWSQAPAGSTADVLLARVGLDGVVQDPGGRPVTTAGAARVSPRLVSNGSSLFLTFQASASGPRPAGCYALALDRNLNAISPISVIVPGDVTGVESAVGALWDGARWIVVTNSALVRFAADGTRVDARSLPLTPRCSGDYYINAFLGVDGGGFYALSRCLPYLFRYASDGTSAALTPSFQTVNQWAPRAASDGTGFAVAWDEGTITSAGVRLGRVSVTGAVQDAPSLQASLFGDVEGLILDGSHAQVFGEGSRVGHIGVDLAARTTSALQVLSMWPAQVATARGNGQRLAFVVGPRRPYVGASAIWRYDPAGVPLDGAGIPVTSDNTIAVALDFDGTRYLAAYSVNPYDVFVRRLEATGDFTDVSPSRYNALGPVLSGLGLAFGGGTHLLTWIDGSRRVRATRLGLDGAPVASEPLVLGSIGASADGFGSDSDVSVSFNGRNFVAVWSNVEDRRVRAARVSPAGVVLDATPLLLTEPDARQATPQFSSASDGAGSTLVAYDVFDVDLAALVVRGVFLRDDGAVVPDAGSGTPTDVPTAVDVTAVTDAPAVVDASTRDALVTTDAPADASTVVDASIDAGTPTPDAGAPTADTGVADAGVADAGNAPPDSGGLCAVQSVGARHPLGPRGSFALLLGAAALCRRRRR